MNIDKTLEQIDNLPPGRPVFCHERDGVAGLGNKRLCSSDDLKLLASAFREREWVPINGPEDLPKERDRYLVQERNSWFAVQTFNDQLDAEWWLKNYVAWQPLPPPYTQEGNG